MLLQQLSVGLMVRSRQQREQDYAAAKQRLNLASPEAPAGSHPGGVSNPFGMGSQALDANGKAIYRNRQEELRDPDYQRSGRCASLISHADTDNPLLFIYINICKQSSI